MSRDVDPEPSACADTVVEPVEGNHFVAAYPPFSRWTPEQLPAATRALDTAPVADRAASPLGLYVHVPFCSQRCDFCYYLSHDDRSGEIHGYLDAVQRELALLVERPALRDRRPDFVYFGGGTPSLLSRSQIQSLLQGLQETWSWQDAREVTFECSPRTVTAAKLAALRAAGVTRISLGVQQLDDPVLKSSGRVHSTADAERAHQEIRAAGFPVVNVDLIVGMVGETGDSFHRSLDRIVEWAPECVTLYQLEVPLNTPLSKTPERWDAIPTWPVKRLRLLEAFSRLEEAGYTVVNAYMALRDPQRHRFHYMTDQYLGADLIGAGVASFSYLDGIHWQNTQSTHRYREALDGDQLPVERAYPLSPSERARREILLGLKLGWIEEQRFRDRHGTDPEALLGERWRALEEQGFLRREEQGWAVVREGLPHVDRVLQSLYAPEHQGVRYS